VAPWAVLGALCAAVVAGGSPAQADTLTHEQARQALQTSTDPGARREAARALGEIGTFEDLPRLVAALRDDDSIVRALAEDALWLVWSRSGDADIDRRYADGVQAMRDHRLDAAIETFTRIIEQRPEFAEAWNKRATIYFWIGEYEKSLADCDEVMKRNPYHFGALSGYGMIYIRLDRPERALSYLEKALAINPNLDQVRATIEALRRILRERGRDTI
jgi:tetratricopeptide (TPR) repeat protein